MTVFVHVSLWRGGGGGRPMRTHDKRGGGEERGTKLKPGGWRDVLRGIGSTLQDTGAGTQLQPRYSATWRRVLPPHQRLSQPYSHSTNAASTLTHLALHRGGAGLDFACSRQQQFVVLHSTTYTNIDAVQEQQQSVNQQQQ